MSVRLLSEWRARRLGRWILLGLGLPCAYLGGASAAFFVRQHTASASQILLRLPQAPASASTTRLLVFAPHCDDETLGCAGLIQQTLAAGGTVQTVMLTNGDGFRAAVQRQMRDVRIGPNDFIRFATLRQQESYRALNSLGVKSENVLFLGYPDRGLMPLWNTFWYPDKPYLSAYTGCSRSPYPNTFDSKACYCGQDVLQDVKTALRRYRPTRITVTHPSDDHPDHAAASAFVTRALMELQNDPKEAAWARQARLEYYIVHRGDWPLPQGKRLNASLAPPTEMAYLDTRWAKLPLTPQETERKAQGIALYPSQTALMQRFLIAFARQNEILGTLTPMALPTVPEGSLQLDGKTEDWERLPPVALNPVRDNVLRDLQGGGDLRAMYLCRDRSRLYVRLDTRQAVARRMIFTLHLRPFGPQGETGTSAFTVRLSMSDSNRPRQDGIKVATDGHIFEAAIPWTALASGLPQQEVRSLAVSADTTLAGVEIDQTGVRFVTLQ